MYLVDDNPESNLNTEYYNRFVDPFNCKFECTVAEHSKEKISRIDNFEISNNVGSIKIEFCKIEIRPLATANFLKNYKLTCNFDFQIYFKSHC